MDNTLKELVGKLPTNCLSVLDHFVASAVTKGLKSNFRTVSSLTLLRNSNNVLITTYTPLGTKRSFVENVGNISAMERRSSKIIFNNYHPPLLLHAIL